MLILTDEVLWHLSESNLTASAQATVLYEEFENCTFTITATFPRDQWVNMKHLSSWQLGLHIVTDFSISIPILILHFDTDINSIHITIFTKPSYPELGYSALKSRELPSRAPHTAYCNCLCSNNVQRKLPQSLPGQYSHIKFPHFIGVNWYFMVSRVIFCYFIATFLLNTGCKYQFRISFGVCHFDTLDRYRVVTILDRIV